MTDDRIAPDFATVAFVVLGVVGLLVLASALPPLTGAGYADSPDAPSPVQPFGGENESTESGSSTGETGSSGSASNGPGSNGTGSDGTDDPGPELRLSDSTPTPGEELRVTVIDDGTPIEGASVLFNGEAVGTTDEDGEITATVPYVESLSVSADVDGTSAPALADAPGDRTRAATASFQTGDASTTITTDSTLDASLDGSIYPGGTAEVSVTVGSAERPVEDALVVVGDREVSTNESGEATFSLPEDASSAAIEVSRGELSWTERIALDIEANVDAVPIALSRATVEAQTSDGYPVDGEGVSVYVLEGTVSDPSPEDLSEVKPRTSLDSREPVWLPAASSATVVVEAGGQTDAVVYENLLRNLGILALGTLSIGWGIFVTYGRLLGRSPSRDLKLVGLNLKLGALNLGRFFEHLGTTYNPLGALARLGEGLGKVVFSVGHSIVTLEVPSIQPPSLPSLTMPTLSVPSLSVPSLSVGDLLAGRDTESDDEPADSSESSAMPSIGEYDPVDPDLPEAADPSNRELVRAAWHELAERAGIADVATTTPGAVADAARAAGVPGDGVDVITTVFRRIEYSEVEPTDERTDQVLRALAAIRAAGGDDR